MAILKLYKNCRFVPHAGRVRYVCESFDHEDEDDDDGNPVPWGLPGMRRKVKVNTRDIWERQFGKTYTLEEALEIERKMNEDIEEAIRAAEEALERERSKVPGQIPLPVMEVLKEVFDVDGLPVAGVAVIASALAVYAARRGNGGARGLFQSRPERGIAPHRY